MIHGNKHHLRDALNAYILAVQDNVADEYINEIVVASGLHDLLRENDKNDIQHGKRSADWYKKNKNKVDKLFIKSQIN